MHKGPLDPTDPADQYLQTRTVLCFGEVTPPLAQRVAEQLLLLASRSSLPIKLVVNAQGGPVSAGEALYDVVAGLGAPVRVIGAGAVSSAAALAFVAPPRDQRFCLPHARFSLFQNFGTTAPLGPDPQAVAQELARHRRRVQELLARQTGQAVDTLARDTERQLWLSADEALAYGLVGKVIERVGDA